MGDARAVEGFGAGQVTNEKFNAVGKDAGGAGLIPDGRGPYPGRGPARCSLRTASATAWRSMLPVAPATNTFAGGLIICSP